MKKLLLSMAVVAMLFSCSKDNIETETTADLTQMLPTKTLDQSSEGLYVGVFGNSEINDLHGKIFINANNNGNYSATIEMVNGNDIKFKGSSLNKTNIHFTSKRGSFDFNTLNFSAPEATNVFIDNEESYIVTVKAKNNLVPHVLLGTYEETGNEANFYGNWDMIGDDVVDPIVCCNNQGLAQILVTHRERVNPFVVTSFATSLPGNGCDYDNSPPHLLDVSGDGNADSVLMGAQTNSFGVNVTNYYVNYFNGTYYSIDCFSNPTSGSWSIGGRSGSVTVVGSPAPLVGAENVSYPLAGVQ